jgi:hypothetical protein
MGNCKGGIVLPGAVIMVNPDLSDSIQARLVTQLQITEVITGETFDLRFAADPDYPRSVRILRQRIMVLRDFRDTTNRQEMDLVLFVKTAMISIARNCFGPVGQTYLLKNVYWGALFIYNNNPDRSCSGCGCSGKDHGHHHHHQIEQHAHGVCGSCGGPTCDGYGRAPYYPATFDPMYPAENHWYNQAPSGPGVFSSYGGCNGPGEYVLCSKYECKAGQRPVGVLDCRLVKDSKVVPTPGGNSETDPNRNIE